MRKNSLIILATVGMLLPLAALADISPNMSSVGSIGTPQESKISMVRELVQFTVPKNLEAPKNDLKTGKLVVMTMPAKATFWLRNTAKQVVTQKVFFPVTYQVSPSGEMKQYAKNVRVSVNGKRVVSTASEQAYMTYSTSGAKPVMSTPGTGYGFSLKIPAQGTATVVVSFDAPVGNNYNNESQPTINYLLASGAGWSGKIGKATIEFIYPTKAKANWVYPDYSYDLKLAPASRKAVGQAMDFVYNNIEPTSDAVMDYIFVTPNQVKIDPNAKPQTQKYPGCDAQHPGNCP